MLKVNQFKSIEELIERYCSSKNIVRDKMLRIRFAMKYECEEYLFRGRSFLERELGIRRDVEKEAQMKASKYNRAYLAWVMAWNM